MQSTTLKLAADLKSRIAALAEATHTSPHAFMVEAIARETERAERYQRFLADADEAEKEAVESGLAYDAAESFDHARAAARGEPSSAPKATPWRRSS